MRNLDRLRSGDEVLEFMSANLVFGPGSYEGMPWRPLEWQADFIRGLYDPRRADGSRIIDRALLLTPKGAGKTELAGAIAVVELLLRESAEVVIAAATWHQVGLLKASADGCCSHPNSALASLVEVTEPEIRLRGTTSRIVRVASDAGSNDGLRPTALVRDEVHEWNTPSRERNHLVLSNGLAKRRGLQLDISTVGADRETLLGRYDAYCRRVAKGEILDERLLYASWSAEGLHVDLDTDEGLRSAILAANPSATGPDAFVDVEEVARRFRSVPRPEGKRYFLNIWGDGGSGQWLPEGAWAALEAHREVHAGTPVYLGFDGSTTSDSTALVAVAELDEGPHAFLLGVWERPEDAGEWLVPRAEVMACVEAAFQTYDVRMFHPDPWGWWEEAREWSATYGEDRVVLFKTNHVARFAEACSGCYAALLNRELTHDGSEVLARHLRNAVPREHGYKQTTIGKIHAASPKRIDAAVALVLAWFARSTWVPPAPAPVYRTAGF
ncbi:MAG: terminase large subunit [Actinomycetota bacterium]|nr:terminase large subunit [Actinomycetota bacterium]